MPLDESIRFFAATDVGQVRSHNEDNYLIDRRLGLFIVADGMGGHAAGEVASAMAVRLVHEEIKRNRAVIDAFASGEQGGTPPRRVLQVLEQAVQRASARIYETAQADRTKRGMGTTCSLLLMAGDTSFVAHVGDSRVYLLRQGKLQQLTEDHTLHNDLLKRGLFTPEQLDRVAQRNAITRALGIFEQIDVDTQFIETQPGDAFLVCSDGLHGYIESVADLLGPLEADDDSGVKALLAMANERGGKDNITAIHVHVGTKGAEAEARAKRQQHKRETLAKMRLFSRLSSRELRRVLEVAFLRVCKAGEAVMTEGQSGDELYIVLSGQLRVQTGDAQLSTLGPGEHVGEMALLRHSPRSATVISEVPSELLVIKRADFFELLRKEPELSVKLLWQLLGVLADRLDQTSRDLRNAHRDSSTSLEPVFEDENATGERPTLPTIEIDPGQFSGPPTQRGN